MLDTDPGYKTLFYVLISFAVALFIFAFFVVEETSYDRKAHTSSNSNRNSSTSGDDSGDKEKADGRAIEQAPEIPARKTFMQTLKPWGEINPKVNMFGMMWRSFTYFLVPQVFWVVTTYGINIGLGALVFNFVFPLKVIAPPYNWSAVSTATSFSP